MNARFLMAIMLAFCLIVASATRGLKAQEPSEPLRPNILWITSEDNGQQLGCYGDQFATTPHLDTLAAKGMMYLHAWSNAPVCAPARTTIITGMYPTSLGAQHMRSAVKLPVDFKLLPELLREQGYYCTNNSKTDYNLLVDEKTIWNRSSKQAHWRHRRPGQPFFAVFNITTTHESQLRTRPHSAIHDPARVAVPPYHPDTAEVRQDWAQYYDKITEMDREVGDILRQLETDGLAESTIVFYFGDHGSGMPRSKRWLYESGLRVPLIVHIPGSLKALVAGEYEVGKTSQRLVSFVDLAPTMLSLAGVRPPDYLQGRAFLGDYVTQAPKHMFAFRDRMDERYDLSRAIRDTRYSYIRNFFPQRPQGTYLEYMFQTPTTVVWKRMFDEGKLDQTQSAFWKTKPAEELYDLAADPHQIRNLVAEAEHAQTLHRLRSELRSWMIRTGDLGLLPEGELWTRADAGTPYTLSKNAESFPIEEMIAVADQASTARAGDLGELLRYRDSTDSASRFWLASGLLWRAQLDMDREACVDLAGRMSSDPSPYVRCLANEILARFGSQADRKTAIDALVQIADVRSEGYFAALTALNSLDWCQPTQLQIGRALDSLPETSTELHQRYSTYIPRMIHRIVHADN
jgi:arylsulfatase A-like enzyme